MAKRIDLFKFMISGTTHPIYVVPDDVLIVIYDTTNLGITNITILNGNTSSQVDVVAAATTVVNKIGADSMIQVSRFGQPANILYWLSLEQISAVFLAIDDPIGAPGPVGATRILFHGNRAFIDVSDSVATITDALGYATLITYP